MVSLISGLWSPYIVGAGIGILVTLGFILSNKAIGCSNAYARTFGMIEKSVRGEKVKEKPYYKKFIPKIDWEWMLILGVVFGAFLSSVLSGSFTIETVPAVWANTFGADPVVRLIGAFIGGLLLGFGARMAGGCTSGHGISGTIQLALSSWSALIFFFIGGIFTALLVHGGM
ncbi:MAG: YeeE/YedE thiosulfate transporter family protein [Candidatus Natronoplasma sp.]